jgi:sugar O-acyltransferase (sialic acid O-acetyltransferase NeuD family)
MKELLIYCAGGFGKEVMDVARRLNESKSQWSDINFIDDGCVDNMKYGAKVLKFEDLEMAGELHSCEIVIANGEPAIRQKIRTKLENAGLALGIVIDTSCIVARTARIEEGVVITPFCSISSDVIIRKNASVNTTSIIGHDVEIGENSVISSMVNLGGACKVGMNSYIGMGVLIKEGVSIGNDVIIGMGSVVYNDIPDGVIALGNPARPMRPNVDKKVFK